MCRRQFTYKNVKVEKLQHEHAGLACVGAEILTDEMVAEVLPTTGLATSANVLEPSGSKPCLFFSWKI